MAVHVRGRARFMNDEAQQDAAMDALVAAFEGGAEPWSRARLTEEQYRGRVQAIYRGRVQAIRAFEIEIEHLEGVFKLSQDKPVTDQQAVIAGLERESNEPVLVEYMKRRLAGSLSGSG
ncbi:MAG: FMN-binding negative transcriptional regulator [Polyangiaceae bacterium]